MYKRRQAAMKTFLRIKNYFFPIVVVLVLVILAVSFYGSLKTQEGMLMPNTIPGTMYNSSDMKSKPLSASEIVSVMNENMTNIQNHDTILATLDPTYAPATSHLVLELDISNNYQRNVQSMLTVMKAHDDEIKKLLPNYIASPDLTGMMDGSLLADKQQRLYNLSHFSANPLDCSLNVIKDQITSLKNQLARAPPAAAGTPPPMVDPNSQVKSQITTLESNMDILKINLQDPNFTQCDPPVSLRDADAIFVGYQLSIITNIIGLQDASIVAIQQKVGGSIVNFYSGLYNNTGAGVLPK